MAAPTKYITLRDDADAGTSVNLYNIIRRNVRSVKVFNNTEYVLADDSIAVDYGTDKRVWRFVIDTQVDFSTNWTAANLTTLESLYALRTTQTIQLVDNWKESAEVVDVHFVELQEMPHESTGTDKYVLVLKEV